METSGTGRPEAGKRSEGLEKGLLDQVRRLLRRDPHGEQDGAHPHFMPQDQRLERLRPIPERPPHQRGIGRKKEGSDLHAFL
jgi:hypothetical protein